MRQGTAERKTKKKWTLQKFAVRLFSVTSVLYLLSAIGLGAYNSALNQQVQDYSAEIVSMQKENEAARLEVNSLSTYDRISAIARENGMSVTTNVVVITDE